MPRFLALPLLTCFFFACGGRQPGSEEFAELQKLEGQFDEHVYAIERCEVEPDEEKLNVVCDFTEHFKSDDMAARCLASSQKSTSAKESAKVCPGHSLKTNTTEK